MVYQVTLTGPADAFLLYADTNATAVAASATAGTTFDFPVWDASKKAATNFWLECRQPGTGTVTYAYSMRPPNYIGEILITTNALKFTAATIIAEPITFFPGNPAGNVQSGTASYYMDVKPTSLISSITWSNDNNRLTFQGASTGTTNVTVKMGNTLGNTKLTANLKGFIGKQPEFNVNIYGQTSYGIDAWIVGDGTNWATTPAEITNKVNYASLVLKQKGIHLYVRSVTYTNRADWLTFTHVVSSTGTIIIRASRVAHDTLGVLPHDGNGIKVVFVNSIQGANGFNGALCIGMGAGALPTTLPHEIGHALGLKDIYISYRKRDNTVENINDAGAVKSDYMNAKDWGAGYYPENLMQTNLVKRLLMYGVGNPASDARGYIPHESVYGVWYEIVNSQEVVHKGVNDKAPVGLDCMTKDPKHPPVQ